MDKLKEIEECHRGSSIAKLNEYIEKNPGSIHGSLILLCTYRNIPLLSGILHHKELNISVITNCVINAVEGCKPDVLDTILNSKKASVTFLKNKRWTWPMDKKIADILLYYDIIDADYAKWLTDENPSI